MKQAGKRGVTIVTLVITVIILIVLTGAVMLGTSTYGYTINGASSASVSIGLPVSSFIWLASPSSNGTSYVYIAHASRVSNRDYDYGGEVCPVVCLKSSIPATWNSSTNKWDLM